MPVDFSKSSIYNKENGFSAILFGAGTRVTELELNEMQDIVRNKLKLIMQKQVGDGFYSDTAITYSGGTLSVAGGYAVLNGEIIPISTLTLALAEGESAYLDVYESTLMYTDTIKRFGNQQDAVTETNNMYDSRVGFETARRVQVKHTLVKTTGVSGHTYLKVGTITSGALVINASIFKTADQILAVLSSALTEDSIGATATANKLLRLDANAQLPASITGNSATATKWATARTLSMTGDATGSGSIDGSGNVSIALTLKTVGATGTFTKVTTDAYGRITSGASLLASDIPTLTASKISDLVSTVKAVSLDQMSAPLSDISFGGFKLTNIANPVNGTDAVNKTYADNLRAGISTKDPVKVATLANIILSGTQTIDTIAVIAGDRVLVKNQTDASQNGIYTVASGAWSRTTDADNSSTGEVVQGMATWVDQGSQSNSRWTLTTAGTISLGTTLLTFSKDFQSADMTADESTLTKTGSTFAMKSGIATAGTFKSVTVDTYGRVTAGSNPTTLLGYGITDATPSSHMGATGTAHGAVTTSVNGFMLSTDKTRLDGIADNANNYVHPTGDGSMHVPATSTTNNAKVLTAGATAGTFSWQALPSNSATATALQTARSISLGTDATGSASFDGKADVTIAVTLASTGVTAGTYRSVTVDVKGRVTGGSNPTTLSGYGITDATPSSHMGATGTAHGVATQLVNGFFSTTDKTKLDGIATNANNYSLPMSTASVLGGVKSGGDITVNTDATMLFNDNFRFMLARDMDFRG